MSGIAESAPQSAVASPGKPGRDFRTLGPWFAGEFFNSCAASLFVAACYDFANHQLQASQSGTLFLSMFWGITYIPIALFAGRISEKYGPLKAAASFTGLSVLSSLLCLLVLGVPNLWALAALMLPYNMFCTPIWVSIESGLSRTYGKMPLSTRMGLFNISWGSANFVAMFTRGALEHTHWSLIFIVPAIIHLGTFILLRFWSPPADLIGTDHVPDDAHGEHELDAPGMRERAKKLLMMAWIGNTMCYVAIYVLMPLLLRLSEMAHVGELVGAGMITSAWSFARFAGFALAWLWAGWHYKARWLMGAQLAAVATFFIILMVHSPWVFVVAQIVFGLSVALIYSAALYYAMHVSSGHGGHAGIHEALVGVGVALGPGLGAVASVGALTQESAMLRTAIAVTTLLLGGTAIMGYYANKARQVKVGESHEA